MDTYVQHFHPNVSVNELVHDVFYSSQPIRDSFNDYIATIVKRYADEPSVLGWEAANDPRCNSTLPASTGCTPQTITRWTSEVTTVIKQNDPNHLVASGDSGFYCIDCTKVFPFTPPPPAPSMRRRSTRRESPLTKSRLLAMDDAWKRRNLPQKQERNPRNGRSFRAGKWMAPRNAG
jgi:mannan endo-1,4-beta-mannosidase